MSFQRDPSTDTAPGLPLGAVVSFCLVVAIFALLIALAIIGKSL